MVASYIRQESTINNQKLRFSGVERVGPILARPSKFMFKKWVSTLKNMDDLSHKKEEIDQSEIKSSKFLQAIFRLPVIPKSLAVLSIRTIFQADHRSRKSSLKCVRNFYDLLKKHLCNNYLRHNAPI